MGGGQGAADTGAGNAAQSFVRIAVPVTVL
jgi:hypothetical protein